jgi:hypothetical protein
MFIPPHRTGHAPAGSQGIGHLYSKLSYKGRAEVYNVRTMTLMSTDCD